MKSIDLALIGCGTIGGAALELLRNRPEVRLVGVVARAGAEARVLDRLRALGLRVPVVAGIGALPTRPDLCLECAGHEALEMHVVPALARGIDCIVASTGALAHRGIAETLEAAACASGARVHLIAGAIGAIDALAAAREGGLDEVRYTGRKPAAAWHGTPAQALIDLERLEEPAVIFEGSARDAARLYPRNANVAATVALAGLGLDATRARLIADPLVSANIHHLEARGDFGDFELTMRGRATPGNAKTSNLTAWSAVRAIMNQVRPLTI